MEGSRALKVVLLAAVVFFDLVGLSTTNDDTEAPLILQYTLVECVCVFLEFGLPGKSLWGVRGILHHQLLTLG